MSAMFKPSDYGKLAVLAPVKTVTTNAASASSTRAHSVTIDEFDPFAADRLPLGVSHSSTSAARHGQPSDMDAFRDLQLTDHQPEAKTEMSAAAMKDKGEKGDAVPNSKTVAHSLSSPSVLNAPQPLPRSDQDQSPISAAAQAELDESHSSLWSSTVNQRQTNEHRALRSEYCAKYIMHITANPPPVATPSPSATNPLNRPASRSSAARRRRDREHAAIRRSRQTNERAVLTTHNPTNQRLPQPRPLTPSAHLSQLALPSCGLLGLGQGRVTEQATNRRLQGDNHTAAVSGASAIGAPQRTSISWASWSEPSTQHSPTTAQRALPQTASVCQPNTVHPTVNHATAGHQAHAALSPSHNHVAPSSRGRFGLGGVGRGQYSRMFFVSGQLQAQSGVRASAVRAHASYIGAAAAQPTHPNMAIPRPRPLFAANTPMPRWLRPPGTANNNIAESASAHSGGAEWTAAERAVSMSMSGRSVQPTQTNRAGGGRVTWLTGVPMPTPNHIDTGTDQTTIAPNSNTQSNVGAAAGASLVSDLNAAQVRHQLLEMGFIESDIVRAQSLCADMNVQNVLDCLVQLQHEASTAHTPAQGDSASASAHSQSAHGNQPFEPNAIPLCGHLCMCWPCAHKYLQTMQPCPTCPVCRAPIIDIIKVYK